MERQRYDDAYTKSIPGAPDVVAADGMDVRILISGTGGSMAHFELAEGKTGRAVRHKTVEEVWYVLEGRFAIWRSDVYKGSPIEVGAGDSFRIPVGTSFQVKVPVSGRIKVVAVTTPPWPGDDEVEVVEGYWPTTVDG